MDRIKVKFKKDSPYSEYGYYETGETGDVMGFTQGCVIILKSDGSFVKAEPNWIEEVKDHTFPELAESEDEEIRKEVLNFAIDMDCKKSWIEWLEKQGEQKPTAEEVLIKAGLKPYKDGDQWCILVGDNIQEGICGFGYTIEDALYEFLKELAQGEQKPVETKVKWDSETYSLFIPSELYDKLTSEFKPLWKKEIEQAYINGRTDERNKQKYEWSKEDEKHIKFLCALLLGIKSKLTEYGKEYQAEVDWLKSLRPPYYCDTCKLKKSVTGWKPTEEHLQGMRRAICKADKGSDAERDLKDLYEQLKAL